MNSKRTWIEKLGDFISGKGFYLVVLICVAAIALSGFYLIQGVRDGLDDGLDQPVSGSAGIVEPPLRPPGPAPRPRPGPASSSPPPPSPRPLRRSPLPPSPLRPPPCPPRRPHWSLHGL